MAKSKETSNKKEKEKKKLKKRQDKEVKKEERQLNSNKGKSFEDMLAYVDEYGNIVSTPPDPTKKIEINTEDIVLGARKQEVENPEDNLRKGVITFFNHDKGYGFIRDSLSQESIFVHINSIEGVIKERDKVTFSVEKGPKGPNAVGVKIVV